MKLKDLRLDVEALFSQALHGHGFLHYGYWPEGAPSPPSLEKLGRAQQTYFDRMLAMIPDEVTNILDVGSGTGSNAKGLIDKGYKVDCVCPSSKLNQMAREKLPAESVIFECGFEDFVSTSQYDLLLFCESFHYIRASEAIQQAGKYSGKFVLIFDYFRRVESKKVDRITYKSFIDLINESAFKIIHDEDVTEAVRPTFLVLDNLKNVHLKPFGLRVINEFKKEHPVYSLLFHSLIKKLSGSIQKKSNRYEQFPKKHEYRLILLEKK
jgi:SAM-dependent methyltransferase